MLLKKLKNIQKEMSKIQIRPSILKEQIENGAKLKDLVEIYELPMSQMRGILKELGFKIRKFHEKKYEILYDEENLFEEEKLPAPTTIENYETVEESNTIQPQLEQNW